MTYYQKLLEIFPILTVRNILLYLLLINIIGFVSMYLDKQKAKKGSWRTPEKTLLTIAFIGGSMGSLAGMYKFRHKTKKSAFSIGIPVMLIIQIAIVIYALFGTIA